VGTIVSGGGILEKWRWLLLLLLLVVIVIIWLLPRKKT
jgi:hypothetical protein